MSGDLQPGPSDRGERAAWIARRFRLGCLVVVAFVGPGAVAADSLHVSPAGRDADAGTAAAPLATIQAALARLDASTGGEIVLHDGVWEPRQRVSRAFAEPVVIRAAHPGRAVLQDCLIHGASNVVVDGVRFDAQESVAVANVCQVSQSGFVTLRNCTFRHGAGGHHNADALKINDGSHHVLVEHCRLEDGTDEELDILQGGVSDLVIRDTVFRQTGIRKPEAGASVKLNASRIAFVHNVFAAMNPESSNGALRFGGSETTDQRPFDLLAVGNVFVHNQGRCDLNLGGVTRVLVADNVFFGPRGRGVIEAATNYPAGGNPNDAFFIVNNIFADPAGGLPTLYALRNGTVAGFTIRNNLYSNGAAPVVARQRGEAFFDPGREREAQFADPLFVGPLAFAGEPDHAWREFLAVRPGSPYLVGRVPLDELNLPDSLAALVRAVLQGEGPDDWYRRILPAAGVR